MTEFHQPDIDEWQPSPRVARLAAKYTLIRHVYMRGHPDAHAAFLVVKDRCFDVGDYVGLEEASEACYRLACSLDRIVEDEREATE